MAKPLVFVLPVIWYIWEFEKGKFAKFGLRFGNVFRDLYLGIGLGLVLAAEAIVGNYLKYGELSFVPVLPVGSYGLFPFLGLSLATSVAEEILGRGFLYTNLKFYLSHFQAELVSSLLFTLIHFPIVLFLLQLAGINLGIYLFSVFALSIANCLLLRYTGSLVTPVLVHTFWNATIGLYL